MLLGQCYCNLTGVLMREGIKDTLEMHIHRQKNDHAKRQQAGGPVQGKEGLRGNPPLFLLLSCSVMSDSLRLHVLQHTRPPCPTPSPGACPNSCPLSQWCHSTISSSVIPFSLCLQSFPASGSFPMSQLFTWGGQSIGASASASVLSMNIQGWYPLGLTGWAFLLSKVLSKVFSLTIVQKHQFFGVQPFLLSSSHIWTWLLEKP